MNCAYPTRGGMAIGVNGEIISLINIVYKEQCTMHDILGIRLDMPNFWHHGCIKVITKKTVARMRSVGNKTPAPYAFSFEKYKLQIFVPFYEELLSEIRRYKGSQGTLKDGWWIWPEEAPRPEPVAQDTESTSQKALNKIDKTLK